MSIDVCCSDDTQWQGKFKELEVESERSKQSLTARIKQLQAEIDSLVKEKKQPSISKSKSITNPRSFKYRSLSLPRYSSAGRRSP